MQIRAAVYRSGPVYRRKQSERGGLGMLSRVVAIHDISCVGTVSYTHLDVYKRQLWNNPAIGSVTFGKNQTD